MGKGKKKARKKVTLSRFQEWQKRHVENQFLINRVAVLVVLIVALIFTAYEMDGFTRNFGSLYIGLLRNGLLIVGYAMIGAVSFSLFGKRIRRRAYFKQIALINLGSGLLASYCLIMGPIFWLASYFEQGKSFESIVSLLLGVLLLILVLKGYIATKSGKIDDSTIDSCNFVILGIKALIFMATFIGCRAWVLFDEQELILIMPLAALVIGLSLFGIDAIVLAGYLLWTDEVYVDSSHQHYLTEKQKNERQNEKTKNEKVAQKAKRSWWSRIGGWLVKGLIAAHLVILLGGTFLSYVSKIDETLQIHPDLTVHTVMTIRLKDNLSKLAFLNPIQSVPRSLPKVHLADYKPVPLRSTEFFVLDELAWLTTEQRELVMSTNRQLLATETKPQVVLVLIDESRADFDAHVAATFDDWRIGDKELNNGLLLFFARNQGLHNVRIEVGYGLEEVVTDGLAGQLLSEQRDALKSQDSQKVSASLIAIFQQLVSIIQLSEGAERISELPVSDGIIKTKVIATLPSLLSVFLIVLGKILFVDFVVLMIIFAIFAIFDRSGSGGSGGSHSSGSGGSWSSGGGGYSGGGGRSGGGGASI